LTSPPSSPHRGTDQDQRPLPERLVGPLSFVRGPRSEPNGSSLVANDGVARNPVGQPAAEAPIGTVADGGDNNLNRPRVRNRAGTRRRARERTQERRHGRARRHDDDGLDNPQARPPEEEEVVVVALVEEEIERDEIVDEDDADEQVYRAAAASTLACERSSRDLLHAVIKGKLDEVVRLTAAGADKDAVDDDVRKDSGIFYRREKNIAVIRGSQR
jgi:hypothetical protein